MPDWLNAIILGLVEGLTEFIPVSSTGHLLLTKLALGLEGPAWDTLIVLIQLGAILAVVALYFSRLWSVVLKLPTDPAARRFVLSVLIAFLPAVVLGVALHDTIKELLFESPRLICISLIVGGVVLIVWHKIDVREITAGGLTAVVGLQAFIIIGGIVRLVPLTGVTLPFMSYGGSSVVVNFGIAAILLIISQRSRQGLLDAVHGVPAT
jgi:undecaprenyl pyrophosphate phosphatase UppP